MRETLNLSNIMMALIYKLSQRYWTICLPNYFFSSTCFQSVTYHITVVNPNLTKCSYLSFIYIAYQQNVLVYWKSLMKTLQRNRRRKVANKDTIDFPLSDLVLSLSEHCIKNVRVRKSSTWKLVAILEMEIIVKCMNIQRLIRIEEGRFSLC